MVVFEVEPKLGEELFNIESGLGLSEEVIDDKNDLTHLFEGNFVLMRRLVLSAYRLNCLLNLVIDFLFENVT